MTDTAEDVDDLDVPEFAIPEVEPADVSAAFANDADTPLWNELIAERGADEHDS